MPPLSSNQADLHFIRKGPSQTVYVRRPRRNPDGTPVTPPRAAASPKKVQFPEDPVDAMHQFENDLIKDEMTKKIEIDSDEISRSEIEQHVIEMKAEEDIMSSQQNRSFGNRLFSCMTCR